MSATLANALSCLLAAALTATAAGAPAPAPAPAGKTSTAPAPAANSAPAVAAAPAAAAANAAGPGDPVDLIRKKDAELQKLLREKPAKTERIKVLINGIFDFEELGKKALGPELWKSMPPDQQQRFVKAFREMVENSSIKKLEAYQSDSTTYEAPSLRDGKATVTSHVFNKGTESIVVYKLLVKDGSWRAWDLVIDDLSTAGNYGDQFKKILQTSDMNGLIARLEKKAAGTDAKPGSGTAGGAGAKPTDNVKSKSEKAASAPPAGSDPAKKAAPAGSAAPAKPAPGTTGAAKSATPPKAATTSQSAKP